MHVKSVHEFWFVSQNSEKFRRDKILRLCMTTGDTRWRSWLRLRATSQKVANLSGRNIALGSTQSLTEMSTRNTSYRVKAAGT